MLVKKTILYILRSLLGNYVQLVKSDASLSRLYSHMRHPSFSAITIVLLARPSMTLDRYLNVAFLSHDFSQGSAGRCADQLHVPCMESRP